MPLIRGTASFQRFPGNLGRATWTAELRSRRPRRGRCALGGLFPAVPVEGAPVPIAGVLHMADQWRRQQGITLDAFGLGPVRTPSEVILETSGLILHGYRGSGPPHVDRPPVLIVPAPIKRAWIWDVEPAVSVVQRLLGHGLRVFLVEWTSPVDAGLDAYADRLLVDCLDAVRTATGHSQAVLAGHSLGGTFAAIFAARRPDRVHALALVESPLRFGAHAGALAQLVVLAPHGRHLRAAFGDIPGSMLDLASLTVAPDAFVWERWADLAAAVRDPAALRTHLRVVRWTLDEFPFPGRLFEDVLERLYRHDAFARGRLTVAGRQVGPGRLSMPMLHVVNPRSRVVPPSAVLPVHEQAPTSDKPLHWYPGEWGVGLQHLGGLVGRRAHAQLWPKILAWLDRLPGDRRAVAGRASRSQR
jgi:polyhydroxyalkanoate synthase